MFKTCQDITNRRVSRHEALWRSQVDFLCGIINMPLSVEKLSERKFIRFFQIDQDERGGGSKKETPADYEPVSVWTFPQLSLKYFKQNRDSLSEKLRKFTFVSFIQEAISENLLCAGQYGGIRKIVIKLAQSLTWWSLQSKGGKGNSQRPIIV